MAVSSLSTYLAAFPYTVTNYYDMSTSTAPGLNATIPSNSFWQTRELVGETPHIVLLYKDLGSSIQFYCYSWWLDQAYGGNCQGSSIQLYIDGNFKRLHNSTGQQCHGDFNSTYAKTNMSVEIRASYSHCDIDTNTTTWSTGETLGPISLTFDTTPPTISLPNLNGAAMNYVNGISWASDSSVTVSFTASDSGGSGLKGIHLSPGGFTSGGSASHTFNSPGKNITISAYAEDNANLFSDTKSYTFSFDDVPPTTTIAHNSAVTPEGGINYSNVNPFVFDVTASDAESGIDYIEWSGTDSSTGQVNSDSGTVEITTEGEEITVSVDAYDVAGNKSTSAATETVFIDTAEPEVSLALTSPEFTVDSKSYYATTSVDIDVEFDDVAGVKQADLYLNGSPISMPVTVPHTSTKNLTGVEGVNMAQLHVTDNAKNETYSSEVIFYVDTTKPVCFINFSAQDTILENDSKYWTKENEIKVDLLYDDPGADPSGIYKGEIVVNGSVPTSKSGFTLPLSGTSKTGHTVSGLSVGKNDIDFCVIDNAENISVKDTITVWVDQTVTTGSMVREEPIATLTDANEYTNTNKFDVRLTMSESDSGLF